MTYRVELTWKIFSKLTPKAQIETSDSGVLFNVRGGHTFVRSLGGNIRAGYRPLTLEPTVNFYQAFAGFAAANGAEGKRFPFRTELAGLAEPVNIWLSIRRYQSVACITVRVSPFEVESEVDFVAIQRLKSHASLYAIIRSVVAAVCGNSVRDTQLSSTPKVFPLLHVTASLSDISNWKNKAVEIITRHDSPNDSVISSVLEKNAKHQIDETLLLIDRQGVFGYAPASSSGQQVEGSLQRFGNACAMVEFAHAIRSDIGSGFSLDDMTQHAIDNPDGAIPNSTSSQNMWMLAVREFSLQSELVRQARMASILPQQTILLVTVTDVETRAVLRNVEQATGSKPVPIAKGDFVYQSLGKLGHFEIFLTICDMGAGGILGSQENIRRSIEAFQPSYVLMVGIAFGVKKKQNVGDILVSKQLVLYEAQRINKDSSVFPRGDKVSCSPRLLNWVKHAKVTWNESTKVTEGLVLSGSKLVDNLEFRKELVAREPEAIGGEMEGEGLYVASQNAGVDWILIKSICDMADGNKGSGKDERQRLAADSASRFVVHMLKTRVGQ